MIEIFCSCPDGLERII